MRLLGFSLMFAAEMCFEAVTGNPLGAFFLFHKTRGNVWAMSLASDYEDGALIYSLRATEDLGPYRGKHPVSRNDVQRCLCSQAKLAPPVIRRALEDLNAILFAGYKELRTVSGGDIPTNHVGECVHFAQFRLVLQNSELPHTLGEVWDRWRNLELAS